MSIKLKTLALTLALASAGCASIPEGPSVMVLPGTGKNFQQFRNDDVVCRQYANLQSGGKTPTQAASTAGVTSAAVGTALGAASGAAIGGGSGAAIGAGAGLAAGGLVGAGAGRAAGETAQDRYDIAYIQCMYAQGHRVPVPGRVSYDGRARSVPPPPPPPSTTPPPSQPAKPYR